MKIIRKGQCIIVNKNNDYNLNVTLSPIIGIFINEIYVEYEFIMFIKKLGKEWTLEDNDFCGIKKITLLGKEFNDNGNNYEKLNNIVEFLKEIFYIDLNEESSRCDEELNKVFEDFVQSIKL